MKKIRAWLWGLALILVLSCLPGTARAYEWLPEDVESRECTLTVTSRSGVTIQTYRVCTVDQWVTFHPTEDFADYETEIRRLCEAGSWTTLLDELQRYMIDKQIEPEAVGVTDKQGKCALTVPAGLYLVTGFQRTEIGRFYQTVPFLICLPNWEKADSSTNAEGTWVYNVEASPKGWEDDTPDKVKVLKIWDVPPRDRLSSVTVELWQVDPATGRGSLYDTKILDRWNHWTFTWTELEKGWNWEVRETDGYHGFRVRYEWADEYNVAIINSRESVSPGGPYDPGTPRNDHDTPPGTLNYPPRNPSDGPPNIPEVVDIDDLDTPLTRLPREDGEPEDNWMPKDEEDINDDDTPLARLPQTGVLWWPVPILALSGMVLFILGWSLHRKEWSNEE